MAPGLVGQTIEQAAGHADTGAFQFHTFADEAVVHAVAFSPDARRLAMGVSGDRAALETLNPEPH
jgi:hypothetical protein